MEIKKIVSATEFSLSYRIILCDLWGVIHNGVEVFSDAKSYLEVMKENNIDVYLISNAPRPEAVVRNGLINKLNLNPELFKKILQALSSSDLDKYLSTKYLLSLGCKFKISFFIRYSSISSKLLYQ